MRPSFAAFVCIVCIASCMAQSIPAQFAVEKMTAKGGVISTTSDDGKTWTEVARGSDPALSPNGKLLAYTYYSHKGTSHERYIRIIDLKSGSHTEPQKWNESVQQYGAGWAGDDTLYFNLFIFAKESDSWEWTTGRLSVPDMMFSRVRDGRPPSASTTLSPNARFRLTTETVQGDPPLDHDTPSALFIEDIQTRSKVRITPKNLWIPSGARWVNDQEIVFPGLWHEDYGKKGGQTWIYRLKPSARDWAAADRRDFEKLRFVEGFQVSTAKQ